MLISQDNPRREEKLKEVAFSIWPIKKIKIMPSMRNRFITIGK